HRASPVLGFGNDDVAEKSARTVEEWARELDLRPWYLATIDRALQIHLNVWMIRTGSPNGRDAEREIQPRGAEGQRVRELPVDRVDQVLVHHHEPGKDGMTCEVESPCAGWNLDSIGCADRQDAWTLDDDRLAG